MKAVIGQEKLVKILENYNLQNAPKTMLFLGQDGCGKSWLTTRFAEQLGIDKVEVDAQATPEKLADYFQCPIQKLYTINLVGMTEQQQNKFLKFIEEPSSNMYIILRAESEVGILNTILNRCIKYTFEPYTVDQLKQFDWSMSCDDDVAYSICKTPGQLLELTDDNLPKILDYCNLMLSPKMQAAPYANVVAITTLVNCKDDAKKFNFDLFFDLLIYAAYTKYKKENDEFSYKVYLYTIKQKAKILNKNISKESFLLSFCDGLWRLSH